MSNGKELKELPEGITVLGYDIDFTELPKGTILLGTEEEYEFARIGLTPKGVAVYSADCIVEKLVERDLMTHDDAYDYFYYNIEGAYVGDKTPIYIWDYYTTD